MQKEMLNINIEKKTLRILLDHLLFDGIKAQVTDSGKRVEFTWEEFLSDLVIDGSKRYIDIHYKYISVYRDMDYEGEVDTYPEIIEFTLSKNTDNSKEHLEELEKETHIDKNNLYWVINVLKNI